jgi:hypothetical protein
MVHFIFHLKSQNNNKNICQPLIRQQISESGVIGTLHEMNRCQGDIKGYIMSSGNECISDSKLYCNKEKNLIIYEKYRFQNCQGEMTKREIQPGDCVMGVVYSVFQKLYCKD